MQLDEVNRLDTTCIRPENLQLASGLWRFFVCVLHNLVLILQDTEGLFIKSNFEYVRHNERKAVKILNSASKDNQVLKTGESVSAMYFNNLGCLHFQMQKYNLASFYFCRAIAENEKALALIASVDKSE